MDRRRAREQIRFYFAPTRRNIRKGGRKKGGTNSTARGGEGGAICRRKYVCRQPCAPKPHRSSSRTRWFYRCQARRRLVIPVESWIFGIPPPLSRDFPLLSSSTPPVTARHCLQAPVCTYVYNNVTHTPRPRLFLLFRVAARGSKAGTARGRPGFDNRADVQDRDDKRGKEGGSEPCRGRYSMYIYIWKRSREKKEKKGIDTLLFCGPIERRGLRNGGGLLFASGFFGRGCSFGSWISILFFFFLLLLAWFRRIRMVVVGDNFFLFLVYIDDDEYEFNT